MKRVLLVCLALLGVGLFNKFFLPEPTEAQTYGQAQWGVQQGTSTPNVVIFDGVANVAIGQLNTTTHTWSPNLTNVQTGSLVACQTASFYGMLPTNTGAQNLTAWNTLVATVGSNNFCVQWQPGNYTFSGTLSMTLTGLQSFIWNGNGSTFTFPSSNGLTLAYVPGVGKEQFPSVLIQNNLWLTGAAGGFSAISINGGINATGIMRMTRLEGNYYMGDDYGVAHFWATGASFVDTSNVTIEHDWMAQQFSGVEISWSGTHSAFPVSVLNVKDANAFQIATGVSASGYFEGVNVQQSNFTGVGTGVNCNHSGSGFQCDVTGTQISSFRSAIAITNVQQNNISSNQISVGVFNGTVANDAALKLANSPNNTIANNRMIGSNAGDGTYPKGIVMDVNSGNDAITGGYIATFNNNNIVGASTPGVALVGVRMDVGAAGVSGLASPFLQLYSPGQLYIANGTGNTGRITFDGQFQPTADTGPTVTGCGSGPAGQVIGTDVSGTVVVGGGVTACTLVFNLAHTTYTTCTVSSHTITPPAYNPTLAGITLSTVVAGGSYDYICSGV